jgi:alcohol dehydrogenase YqhD (iron-dependent ADH family)
LAAAVLSTVPKPLLPHIFYEGDPWDFFTYKARVTKALPVGVVLTLAATGTEMNVNTVISNDQTQEKIGIGSKHLIPRFAILDPVYTFSVPAEQTAAGQLIL